MGPEALLLGLAGANPTERPKPGLASPRVRGIA